MKVIILMSRLSDYMLNCFRVWQRKSGVEVHVVRRMVDAGAAPFVFSDGNKEIEFYERERLNGQRIKQLVQTIAPQLVICFGWADQDYLAAVHSRPPQTKAVITMDNQWLGTLRQTLGIVWGRLTLQSLFDFIWVPGSRQRRFARMLGFSEDRIYEGFYVANDANFSAICGTGASTPVKRLVFVGRYMESKGLRELWKGFMAYHDNVDSKLDLLCIGAGPLEAERPDHPRIRHLGFVQPNAFATVLKGGGVFILPSRFEPWGVVVHEFAIAGFPLVLSRQVGAGDRFLGRDNGLLLESVTPEAISKAVATIDAMDEPTLAGMSRASAAKGATLKVDDWRAQADAFLASGGLVESGP